MRLFLLTIFLIISFSLDAQTLSPALGFLQIEPDARGSALGLTGVASSPDNFVFYNPAKLSMKEGQDYGISAGYSPYLRKLVKGAGLATIEGFRKMDEQTSIGLDIRYFSLGRIDFKDATGYDIYSYTPAEWCIGLTYSRQLSEYSSIGFTVRYINSRPAAGIEYMGEIIKTANAIGADVGFYTSNVPASELSGYSGGIFRFGASLSNLGTKVKYQTSSNAALQPMFCRAGVGYTFPSMEGDHVVSLSADLSKLLLPSYPIADTAGLSTYKQEGQKSVPAAFFQGWGNMDSWAAGAGLEYLYRQRFYLRAGIHYESPKYSNKQLITAGIGFIFQTMHLDLSYFAPIAQSAGAQNYQSQTLKISLGVNISSN